MNPQMRARAAAARRQKATDAAKFKVDWLDSDFWLDLAKAAGMRLPHWATQPTARALISAHRSLEEVTFEELYGCHPQRLIDLNPRVPLRAFLGMMLERAADRLRPGSDYATKTTLSYGTNSSKRKRSTGAK